jgi:hypothetical protein
VDPSFILVLDSGVEGGIHPHGDRKSPEAIENKGVEERPLRKRVRKRQKRKKLEVDKGHFVIPDRWSVARRRREKSDFGRVETLRKDPLEALGKKEWEIKWREGGTLSRVFCKVCGSA